VWLSRPSRDGLELLRLALPRLDFVQLDAAGPRATGSAVEVAYRT
jgi:hypothetical protein